MAKFINFKGRQKSTCRTLATEYTGQRYRRALFLPGSQMLCVKSALESGIVSRRDTLFHLAERNTRTAKQIGQVADKLGLKSAIVHNDEVTRLDFRYNYTSLEPKAARRVDYAFLDFCGTCTPHITRWLFETTGRWLSPTARIALTFCGKARQDVPWFRKAIAAFDGQMPPEIAESLYRSHNNWSNRIEYDETRALPALASIKGQFLLVASSLPYRLEVHHSFLYKDTATPMVFFHGALTGQRNPLYPGPVRPLLQKWFSKHKPQNIRPADLKPHEWAWNENNPNGIRAA